MTEFLLTISKLISCRQAMRIKKSINYRITNKLSDLPHTHWYVPLNRAWFSISWTVNRVCNFHCLKCQRGSEVWPASLEQITYLNVHLLYACYLQEFSSRQTWLMRDRETLFCGKKGKESRTAKKRVFSGHMVQVGGLFYYWFNSTVEKICHKKPIWEWSHSTIRSFIYWEARCNCD